MSLKVALETLGYDPCYHMTEVFAHPEHTGFWISASRGEPADWDGVLGAYEAAVDWPACTFYEDLMERNPHAKVILSVRDPERWYESVRNTIYELSVVVPRHPVYRIGYKLVSFFVFRGPGNVDLAGEIIWQGTFDGRFEDKTYAIEVFERHSAEVQRRVPEDRLLVYDVKAGWEPLCEFLGVEVPDELFPRTNDTAQMRRRLRGVKALSFVTPVALLILLLALLVLLARVSRRSSLNSRPARRLRS
jgi:Sulfotransferase domain